MLNYYTPCNPNSMSPRGLQFSALFLATGLAICLAVSDSRAGEPYELLTAALRAGGLNEPAEIAQYRGRFNVFTTKLHRTLDARPSERERIEQAFEFLHREVLVGRYCREVSEVQVALDRGDYNCVSATILFVALCEACELSPQICGSPEHVFCRFPETKPLDVETTCRDWFAQPHPSPVQHPGMRPITHRQLVAKIHYNRGVLLLEDQRFPQALDELRRSRELDPHDASIEANLLAGLNNAALSLCRQNRFQQAAAYLGEARELDPAYGSQRATEVYLHHRWANERLAARDVTTARELAIRGLEIAPNHPGLLAILQQVSPR